MLRYLQITFAVAAACSLMAYGWSQVAGPAGGGGGSSTAQSSSGRIRVTEEDYLLTLDLTAKQQQAYDQLNAYVAEEYVKLRSLEPLEARLKRASQISHGREGEMKKILTPVQYKKYDTWIENNIPKSAGAFGGTDVEILKTLKLTTAQWKSYEAFRVQMDAANHRLYRLNRTDAMGAGWFSTEINLMSNSGIKKILTADQWKQYKLAWDKIMHPYIENGKKQGSGGARSLGGGS